MQIGATFSHRQLQWMGHDVWTALNNYSDLGFQWIRLGCYWDEIEPTPGIYDFKHLDALMEKCTALDLKVVLTVGMKAPRWPEYYLPAYLDRSDFEKDYEFDVADKVLVDHLIQFLASLANHFKDCDCLKVWQVENEPLDPSGEYNWKISTDLLSEEIKIIRNLVPDKKILISFWGNSLTKRNLYPQIVRAADIIGFDFYPKVPRSGFDRFFNKYSGVGDSDTKLKEIIDVLKKDHKEVWISEMQAEPWEIGNPAIMKSFLASQFKPNLDWGKSFNPEVLLLWGFEFWYDQKLKGNEEYMNLAKSLNLEHDNL